MLEGGVNESNLREGEKKPTAAKNLACTLKHRCTGSKVVRTPGDSPGGRGILGPRRNRVMKTTGQR